MKGSEIKVGQEYAVQLVVPGLAAQGRRGAIGHRAHFPRTTEVKRAMVIEKRSNGRIIVQHDAMITDPNQHIPQEEMAHAIVNGTRRFVPGKKLLTVTNAAFVCPWEDFEVPGTLDGRCDAPRVTRTAGMVFTEENLAAAQ